MEDNQELLRGATNTWARKIKEVVFPDLNHIDIKIKSKYHNLRNSWKATKQLQDQSGFGLKEDDCEALVNSKIFIKI